MDLDHVTADVFSIKDMLNTIRKDETMKLQLLPIEQELAAITERFQEHFDGNKQDMDSLRSEVEAIKLQLEEMQKARTNDQNIQNVALEQFEKPLSPKKVRSDADRSKRWSFGDIGEMVDKFKGKVEEKFSKTSSKQDKPKERVFFESLKELLETQLAQNEQERLGQQYTISRNRSSTKGSRDSGFSFSLTNTPTGFSSQSSHISNSSSDARLALEGTHHTPPTTTVVTDASITNQTDILSGIKEEDAIIPPTAPIPISKKAPSELMTHSTPFSPSDRDSIFQDNYELLSLRFDGFLSGLLTIVESYLKEN